MLLLSNVKTVDYNVTDDAVPTACPFSDDVSYAFNYNDQTYGFCARSTSHLRPCVNQTRHQFHFHHCVALATFHRRGSSLVQILFVIYSHLFAILVASKETNNNAQQTDRQTDRQRDKNTKYTKLTTKKDMYS